MTSATLITTVSQRIHTSFSLPYFSSAPSTVVLECCEYLAPIPCCNSGLPVFEPCF